MNEFDQEEVSRNRAERSNRALRSLSFWVGIMVGVGFLFNAIPPAVGAFYIVGLAALGLSSQRNLRKLRSTADQE